jgi:two-component system response regulator DevR
VPERAESDHLLEEPVGCDGFGDARAGEGASEGASEGAGERIGVFLLDDHQVVREGVRLLLEAAGDLVVVGQAATAAEALAVLEACRPQVAVVDVRLPDGSGIEVCRDIRSAHPEVACLILTSYADDEALAQAVLAGASGYVLKQIHGSDLVGAVRTAAAGHRLIDQATAERAIAHLQAATSARQAVDRLTPRERSILSGIAAGKTNREIADELYLAEKTVKNQVSMVLAKLGLTRRSQAAAFVARYGHPTPPA